jgi:hypothetical protein
MGSAKQISYIVASDVGTRDGIGLETYVNGDLLLEIFRDDSERRTYITAYANMIDLDVIEASIAQFKARIDAGYIDYPTG